MRRTLLLILLLATLLACKRFFGPKRAPEAHVARVKVGGKWGYVDGTGKPLFAPSLDLVKDFEEGLALARVGAEKTGRWGYVDASGAWKIPARFVEARPFAEGVAAVKDPEKNLWGLIDASGSFVVAPRFAGLSSMSEGLAPAKEPDGRWGYIDRSGGWVIQPRFGDAHRHHQGLAQALGHRWGFIDKSGAFVIPDSFGDVGRFSEDRAAVWLTIGGRLGTAPVTYCYYIGRDGKAPSVFTAHPSECRPMKNGMAAAAEKKSGRLLWGFVGPDGKWAIEPKFRKVRDFSERLCAVQSDADGKWGFVDFDGDWKIDPSYESADDFVDGIAPVKHGGRWGYVDTSGDWVIQPQYEDAMPMLKRSERGL